MPIVDIVLILVALISVVIGLFRGLVREAMSITTLIIAIWGAMYLGPFAGKWLGSIESTELQIWAGRILVFVVVLGVGALLEWGISKIVRISGLSGTDRALGGFFGMVRSALLVGVFILAGRYAGFDADSWWHESKIIPLGEPVADWITDMAPRGVELLQPPDQLSDQFRLQWVGPTGV